MFSNAYKNKTVLITGHTGFKGGWLSLWLHQLGATVVGVSNEIPTRPALFEALKLENMIRFIRADVQDAKKMHEIIHEVQPDFIFHLAAQALVRDAFLDPVKTIWTNVLGAIHVMESLELIQSLAN